MTIREMAFAERIVDEWRVTAGPDNPAGPLYASGPFAESDIIGACIVTTGQCSLCSASHTIACC